MGKLVALLATLLALAVPATSLAEIVRADFGGSAPALVRIHNDDDHDRGRHRGKHRGKHRDDRHEDGAYRKGYRDGRRSSYRDQQHYRPGYREDYRRYGRGQYLPPHYRDQVIYNYHDRRLPPPPHGCRYVQVGQDTYLMQIATGLILNAFLGGGY